MMKIVVTRENEENRNELERFQKLNEMLFHLTMIKKIEELEFMFDHSLENFLELMSTDALIKEVIKAIEQEIKCVNCPHKELCDMLNHITQ